ncbi:iron-sulfur cluster co-chaperone protein HscB-like [Glandiceps talaboti]
MSAPVMNRVWRSCPNIASLLRNPASSQTQKQLTVTGRNYASISVHCSPVRQPKSYIRRENVLLTKQTTSVITHSRNYCSLTKVCWSCHAPVAEPTKKTSYFCNSCDSILPLGDDLTHFELMDCEPSFDVDIERLTQKYRDLQRQIHPDRFSVKTEEEQGYSLIVSSAVNKAYKTLLKPLSRGLYMLELKGMSIEEDDSVVDKEFLFEIMEMNEQIADTQNTKDLLQLEEVNRGRLDQLVQSLSNAFRNDNYVKAKEILRKMKYFVNIEDKIKEKLMPTGFYKHL